MDFIKHPVECVCILPQHLATKELFKFIVLSIIDDNGEVVPSYVQCPNCGNIHKVIEIFQSVTIGKESQDFPLLTNLEEIKLELPEHVRKLLENNKVSLVEWQEAKAIFEHQLWGKAIILKKEQFDGKTIVKYLLIAGKELFQVKTTTIEED